MDFPVFVHALLNLAQRGQATFKSSGLLLQTLQQRLGFLPRLGKARKFSLQLPQ